MTKRRAILKGLTITGVAGATWKKPIIDSVILPSHAQTTGTSCNVNIQLFDAAVGNGFQAGFPGSPPNVPEGALMNFLIETSPACPDAVFRLTRYVNDAPEGGANEVIMNAEGRQALQATAEGEGNTERLVVNVPAYQPPASDDPYDDIGDFVVYFITGGAVSDIRLKKDIIPLKQLTNGIRLYRYKYLQDQTQTEYVGVMAQDLLDSHPDALLTGKDGYYRVKYHQLGMKLAKYDDWKQHGENAVKLSH